MRPVAGITMNNFVRSLSAMALSLMVVLVSTGASADEADTRRLLKTMSDYLTSQQAQLFSPRDLQYDPGCRSCRRASTYARECCGGGTALGAALRGGRL
jgi:hypothetical protein